MTKDSLERFRRAAKALKASYEVGAPDALVRIRANPPGRTGDDLKHADFLHVVARENQFTSWPMMKEVILRLGMDRAARQQRLKIALWHGQTQIIRDLVWDDPDVAEGAFGLQCALYEPQVLRDLSENPALVTTEFGGRRPLLHLTFSKAFIAFPDRETQMFEIAQGLLEAGADVNDRFQMDSDGAHLLSALYGAIGHAGNLKLAAWLLDHGADPNDGESLYHACEMGSPDGVRMLLKAGADPKGTNALPRAMDFDDIEMVQLLLDAGADPNEGTDAWAKGIGIQRGVPVLHQAARRMNSGPVLDLLLEHGADPEATWQGHSAYAFATVFGNADLVERIEKRGLQTPLSLEEEMLSTAAKGKVPTGYIDTAKLPDVYRNILREILHLPEKLPHLKALIAIGMEWDRPDAEGITPVQAAGWCGLPDVMEYFLSLSPNLGHVNGYGGTLLSTILHGAQNNPERGNGDYVACLRLALEEGVSLPRRAIDATGDSEIRTFLSQWAQDKPGQVVEHGIV